MPQAAPQNSTQLMLRSNEKESSRDVTTHDAKMQIFGGISQPLSVAGL